MMCLAPTVRLTTTLADRVLLQDSRKILRNRRYHAKNSDNNYLGSVNMGKHVTVGGVVSRPDARVDAGLLLSSHDKGPSAPYNQITRASDAWHGSSRVRPAHGTLETRKRTPPMRPFAMAEGSIWGPSSPL